MSTNSSHFGSQDLESKDIPDHVMRDHIVNPEVDDVIPREDQAKSQLDKLPIPTGWRILIVPYSHPRYSKGGIRLPDSTVKTEELAATVGYVISMGPDAYQDPVKFSEGPWCKVGDYILFGRYAGARIMMEGEKDDHLPLRLIDDDNVIAVINNPEDYVGIK